MPGGKRGGLAILIRILMAAVLMTQYQPSNLEHFTKIEVADTKRIFKSDNQGLE